MTQPPALAHAHLPEHPVVEMDLLADLNREHLQKRPEDAALDGLIARFGLEGDGVRPGRCSPRPSYNQAGKRRYGVRLGILDPTSRVIDDARPRLRNIEPQQTVVANF